MISPILTIFQVSTRNKHNPRKHLLGPNHHAHTITIGPLPTNDIPQLNSDDNDDRGRDFFFFFFFFARNNDQLFFLFCFTHHADGHTNVIDVEPGFRPDGVCQCCGWAYCSCRLRHGLVSPSALLKRLSLL